MKSTLILILIGLAISSNPGFSKTPGEDATVQSATDTTTAVLEVDGVPDSKTMERDLQRLNWKQFRSIVEAVPKLKADIEAYGPIGWKIVRTNYTNYGWKKNIDKLDDEQKQLLAELIQNAKAAK